MDNYTETISSTEPPPLHGDILEAILSHIPLIHLIPLSHVSKSWAAGVSSAFRTSTNTKPWLILHTQSDRHSYQYQYPYPTITHAYDPDSNQWIWIHTRSPTPNHITTLRSSHSNLLYTLSPTNFSFSFDPLHLTWHHVAAPKVSRLDPIVAVVGRRVVVAGGAYDFEDDPLAVEIYDLQSDTWIRSDPMPRVFNHSASPIWLSVASDDPILYLMEKSSGVTYSFDTSTNTWSGAYDLRPDGNGYHSVIGILTGRLIVIGVLGEADDVTGVKVWEVDCDSFGLNEIGEMPVDFVEDLRRCDEVISSIDVVMAGNVVYMCVGERGGEVVVCEVGGGGGGGCRWRKVVNTVGDCGVMGRVVLTCSVVGVEELRRAVRVEDWKFVVKR